MALKASIKISTAVPCIMAWLLACGSFPWKTLENTREGAKPIGRMAAEFTNKLGMKFVLIPAGTFIMGSPLNEPGRDSDEGRHKVTLTRIDLNRFEKLLGLGYL